MRRRAVMSLTEMGRMVAWGWGWMMGGMVGAAAGVTGCGGADDDDGVDGGLAAGGCWGGCFGAVEGGGAYLGCFFWFRKERMDDWVVLAVGRDMVEAGYRMNSFSLRSTRETQGSRRRNAGEMRVAEGEENNNNTIWEGKLEEAVGI